MKLFTLMPRGRNSKISSILTAFISFNNVRCPFRQSRVEIRDPSFALARLTYLFTKDIVSNYGRALLTVNAFIREADTKLIP
jgi:hypothetical protein